MNHQKNLKILFECAKEVDPLYGVRIAAEIHQKRVVSSGTHSTKSHPFQAKFNKPFKIYLHAEIAAIKDALRILNVDELKGCTLYVARAKFEDSSKQKMIQGLAKPCLGCQRAIAEFGISEVVFTKDGEGFDIL